MKKIQNEFLKREAGRLGLNIAGLILCLILIAVVPETRPLWPVFAVAFFAAVGVGAARSFAQTRAKADGLSAEEAALLERQYSEDHPVCKAAYGEIHLLQDFIVGRNKGRLIVVPLRQIEKAEERFRRVGGRRVPCLAFALEAGKWISIDFSFGHYKDGEPVVDWLTERIGPEKVVRGTEKPSILR